MRPAVVALLLFTAASAAFADEGRTSDYSRQTLLRLFSPPARAGRGGAQWHTGYVEFRALGVHWRLLYLPIAAPFIRLEDKAKIPNAFELTRTAYASTLPPPVFDTDRSWELEQEYRRIQRLTAKAQ